LSRRFLCIAVALLLVLPVWAWYWFSHRDERLIRREIREMTALMEKEETETALAGLSRAKDITRRFVLRPMIDAPPYVSHPADRNEFAALIYHYRNAVAELRVEVLDLSVSLAADRRRATVAMVATATARRGSMEESDTREIALEWVKEERLWLVESARLTSTIRHPLSLEENVP